MKTKSAKNYSSFQKVMIIIVPLIIMLLIASLATLGAMYFTHNFGGFGIFSPGNIVIIMALCAAVLAIVGVIFSFVTVGKEPDDDTDEITE
ncbi:MAG: hypothetical protein IJ932_01555 [Ruminococcus sp.]|nr:hypothetical protein [Ruminococcus sp.]